MALPTPEETLMGVTQYNPRKKKTAPVVPLRVERRAPPKVLKKPGTSEWVGTQKPTEQQTPEKTLAPKKAMLDVDTWALQNGYLGTDGNGKRKKVSDRTKWGFSQNKSYPCLSTFSLIQKDPHHR